MQAGAIARVRPTCARGVTVAGADRQAANIKRPEQMSHSTDSIRKFSAYAVLIRSFSVTRQHIPIFSVFVALTAINAIILNSYWEDLNQPVFVEDPELPSLADLILIANISFEIMLLKVTLVHSTWLAFRGQAPTIREIYDRAKHLSFRTSVFKLLLIFLLYFGIGILFLVFVDVLLTVLIYSVDSFVTMVVGGLVTVIALIVVVLHLLARFYVVIPVAVIEQTTVFQSFSRSSSLTTGNRWGILRLLCLILIAAIFVLLAVTFGVSYSTGENLSSSDSGLISKYLFPIVGAIALSLFSVSDGIATTVGYGFLVTGRDDVPEEGGDR